MAVWHLWTRTWGKSICRVDSSRERSPKSLEIVSRSRPRCIYIYICVYAFDECLTHLSKVIGGLHNALGGHRWCIVRYRILCHLLFIIYFLLSGRVAHFIPEWNFNTAHDGWDILNPISNGFRSDPPIAPSNKGGWESELLSNNQPTNNKKNIIKCNWDSTWRPYSFPKQIAFSRCLSVKKAAQIVYWTGN